MRPAGLVALALGMAMLPLGMIPARGEAKGETQPKQAAARKAADAVVKLLDARKYGESWDQAAERFRKGIKRQAWIDALGETRKPIGKLRGRKLNRIEWKGRGTPEETDQAWVYYDIRPGAGAVIGELVIVIAEKDGAWRHSGYFVGPGDKLPRPPEK